MMEQAVLESEVDSKLFYGLSTEELRAYFDAHKDDFKIDYTGSLHITKGDSVDLVVKGDQIADNFKACLDSAVSRNSCHELRAAARGVTSGLNDAFRKE